MNRPLVSVVIPVYNTEKYLNACIGSVLAQSYSKIEVLLVDDGSTDTSGAICETYKNKDVRVRTFHLENGGVSRARNFGISQSTGQYLCFVDSDDTIDEKYIEDFVKYLEEDINIYIQGCRIIKNNKTTEVIAYKANGIQYIENIFKQNHLCSHGYAWGKMYNTTFVKGSSIGFDNNIKFSEDLLFILQCLLYTDKIKYIPVTGYNYLFRSGNASSKRFPFKAEFRCWKEYLKAISLLSKKHNIDLFAVDSVGEISEMLFSRIRNALYKEHYDKPFRMKFYGSLSSAEVAYIYKYSYVCNSPVRFGYRIWNSFGLMLSDFYFSLIYKFAR